MYTYFFLCLLAFLSIHDSWLPNSLFLLDTGSLFWTTTSCRPCQPAFLTGFHRFSECGCFPATPSSTPPSSSTTTPPLAATTTTTLAPSTPTTSAVTSKLTLATELTPQQQLSIAAAAVTTRLTDTAALKTAFIAAVLRPAPRPIMCVRERSPQHADSPPLVPSHRVSTPPWWIQHFYC